MDTVIDQAYREGSHTGWLVLVAFLSSLTACNTASLGSAAECALSLSPRSSCRSRAGIQIARGIWRTSTWRIDRATIVCPLMEYIARWLHSKRASEMSLFFLTRDPQIISGLVHQSGEIFNHFYFTDRNRRCLWLSPRDLWSTFTFSLWWDVRQVSNQLVHVGWCRRLKIQVRTIWIWL
jgi:hypothetical protein